MFFELKIGLINDINYSTEGYNKFRRKLMKELIAFFKDIFMIGDQNSNIKVGLSQFKNEQVEKKQPVKNIKKENKEVKLSDLMRRSA